MNYFKPHRLIQGDLIAIISPSWGGPSIFPQIYENGIKNLESLGLKIKEYPTARANAKYLYDNPKVRAKDINSAFADREVKAIIPTIGGDDSVRIIPFLDKEVIKANPKILMGYSDTTILTTFCNYLGLVVFNGPSIMAGFSQMESLPDQFIQHIKDFLFGNFDNYIYKPFISYSDGYPSWSDKQSSVGKVSKPKQTDGWHWLQGQGIVQGELFGGCIEVLEFIKGTDFWFYGEFWNKKILFLETSEEKPTPTRVKYMLRNYGIQGIFNKVEAVLFGRARDYTDEEKIQLDETILNVIKDEFGKNDLMIVTNMDFGHTDPQIILPLGIKAQLNYDKKEFKLIEAPSIK